jgi:hypothetical protein
MGNILQTIMATEMEAMIEENSEFHGRVYKAQSTEGRVLQPLIGWAIFHTLMECMLKFLLRITMAIM